MLLDVLYLKQITFSSRDELTPALTQDCIKGCSSEQVSEVRTLARVKIRDLDNSLHFRATESPVSGQVDRLHICAWLLATYNTL